MSYPAVQILFNDRLLQTVSLDKPALSIGRMRENDIVIDNLAVSRFHASILLENGQIILEDQDSENGCFVNGERIRRAVITPRDEIIIGKHRLVLIETQASILQTPPEPSLPKTSSAWDASSTYVVDAGTQEKILEAIQKKHEQVSAAESELKPYLEILRTEGMDEILPWTRTTLSIGRAMENDVVLMHPRVSRRHALLVHKDGDYEMQDLDTGNGTLVNGVRKTHCTLKSGDVVSVGDEKIVFRMAAEIPDHVSPPAERPTIEAPLPFPTPKAEIIAEPEPAPQPAPAPAPLQLAMDLVIDLSHLPEPERSKIAALLQDGLSVPANVHLRLKPQ